MGMTSLLQITREAFRGAFFDRFPDQVISIRKINRFAPGNKNKLFQEAIQVVFIVKTVLAK